MKKVIGLLLTIIGLGLFVLPIYLAITVHPLWLLLYLAQEVFTIIFATGLYLMGWND